MKISIRILLVVMAMLLCCNTSAKRVITGDERTGEYFPLLKGKRVALFSNHTGIAGKQHVVDLLVSNKINVVAIFSPEHGFRGTADAGERVGNSVDEKTGIPILSMYGGGKEAFDSATAKKFDVLVVDIQDVGLRYYTYYITMFHLMDCCAEYKKKVIILDRPNPNGFYVDGPILDMKYRSGVGLLPIPIVHGMTLGELAQMIDGEHWLSNNRSCNVFVVSCLNYTHSMRCKLTVPPSPNLPDMKAIYLYPSTCYFEGTVVSLGRGTKLPFQIYGHPDMKGCDFSFTPQSMPGAKTPPLMNQLCYGKNLSNFNDEDICKRGIDLNYVIDAYNNLNMGDKFFTPFFDKLTGCGYIREMIEAGKSAEEIRARWQNDVKKFKQQRQPYLLYEDIK